MATTRAQLRARIGNTGFAGDLIASAVTSGADSTKLIDTTLVAANSAYNYARLLVTSGSASGNARWVTDWTQSTGTFKFDRNLATPTATNDTYELHRQWSVEDKNDAINEAIHAAGRYWWRLIENESLTLASNTYDYSMASFSVPVDPSLGILDVYYQDNATNDTWTRISPEEWNMRNVAGVLKLHIENLPGTTQKLRVIYKARPSTLASDGATLDPDVEELANYICSKATAFLFQKRANLGEEQVRQHWQAMANQMQQQAEVLLAQERKRQPNRRQTTSEW